MNDADNKIEMFHTFYSEAFSDLITITVALIVLVGALIPTVLAMFQKRQIAQEKEFIKSFISNEIETTKLSLQKTIKSHVGLELKKLSKTLSELEAQIHIKLEAVDAGVYHIQANAYSNQKKIELALKSYIDAATCYLKGEDENNLQMMLEATEDNLLKINADNHKNDEDIEINLTRLLKDLKKSNSNSNGRYDRVSKSLQDKLTISLSRVAKNPNK